MERFIFLIFPLLLFAGNILTVLWLFRHGEFLRRKKGLRKVVRGLCVLLLLGTGYIVFSVLSDF